MDALYNIEGVVALLNDMLDNPEKTAISNTDIVAMDEGLLGRDALDSYLDVVAATERSDIRIIMHNAIRGDINDAIKLHGMLCPETDFCIYKDAVRLYWDIEDDKGEYTSCDEIYYEHSNIARALVATILTYLVRKEDISGKVRHNQGYFAEAVKSLDNFYTLQSELFLWLLLHTDAENDSKLGNDSLENFKTLIREVVEYQTRDLIAAIKPTIFRTDITGEESARLGDAYLNFVNNGLKLQ